LFKKSKQSPAILCYQGHILMENRLGLVVGALVSRADGFAERASALRPLDCMPGSHAKTVGADKAYDTRDFVSDCRARNVTPHVARNDDRPGGSAIDGRTSRHAGAAPRDAGAQAYCVGKRRGASGIQQQIACEMLSNTASVNMTKRNSTTR
jgi:hypothetical protein